MRATHLPRRSCGLVLLGLVVGACATPRGDGADPWAGAREASAPQDLPAPPAPVVDTSDGADWVRLSSGEWLTGEIVVLDRKVLELDSKELGDLKLDWADVAEVRTSRDFTLVLEGQVQVIGAVRVLDETVFLTDAGGTREIPRAEVFRMVPGEPSEANFWSGKVVVGSTARSGNTHQVDLTWSVALLRRTARSRLPIGYDAVYSELEGEASADNQRFHAQYDWYLGSRLYVTPLGVEVYRDPFQNLALRVSPFCALGYTLVDTGRLESNVSAGLGYRYTRYDSVEPGEDETDGTSDAVLGASVKWDPLPAVSVHADYSAQIGLEDTRDTNQGATVALSVDLGWDLELDVKARWDRVGLPQPDSDGVVPERDDYRLSVGLGWQF